MAPASPSIPSVKQQILEEFIPGYVSPIIAPSPPKWVGSDTIFAIWIGINDIGATFTQGTSATEVNEKIFAEYESLMNQLYSTGARNFIFINVPTVDRSPGTIARGKAVAEQEKIDVVAWNQLLVKTAQNIKATHTDTNIWMFDANALFSEILNDVASFPQTAGITNTTDFCVAYEK